MGGNAIPNARRIDKQEYHQIIIEIIQLFPELRMIPTRTVKDKADFGDIDFIVETDPKINIKNLVVDRLNNPQVNDNNIYYSFEYKNIQIDFNFVSPNDYMTAYWFHGNADFGNLCGRLARSINFKFGTDGLSYVFRVNDDLNYRHDIIISKDIKEILTFLDINHNKFIEGFDSSEEVFDIIMKSKLFNPTYFIFDNLNHNDRTRNRKRKMYHEFLTCANGIQPRPKLTTEERLDYLNDAIKFFYNGEYLKNQITFLEEQHIKNNEIKKYFNGDLVREKTGIEGKELGNLISLLKTIMNIHYDLDTFILMHKENLWDELGKYILSARYSFGSNPPSDAIKIFEHDNEELYYHDKQLYRKFAPTYTDMVI